jgi:hypothetical protein
MHCFFDNKPGFLIFDNVGAGSPKFLPPTNNLNKPAPTPGLNEINWEFMGGDGAGFPACLFGGTDVGESAPTLCW